MSVPELHPRARFRAFGSTWQVDGMRILSGDLHARLEPCEDVAESPAVAERKAWARLVRAQRAYVAGGMRGDAEGALREYDAAKQALRDLGVDVDALLKDSEKGQAQ